MLKSEFEKLSGIVVSEFQYRIIEQEYLEDLEASLDKAAFAVRYKKDADGLATKVCRMVDEEVEQMRQELRDKGGAQFRENQELKEQIQKLTEQLDKELEWKPFVPVSEVQQEEYERGKIAARAMSIEEAIEAVCDEFGFDPEKVRILTTAPAYEKNRHGVLRVKPGETIDRAPYWCATDDHYIRFTCANWDYEMYNGELRQI